MDKARFIVSAIRRMAQYTFPSLTSVIGTESKERGRHLGSGLRCTLGGRRAIITARHVIQTAQNEPGGFALSAGYAQLPFLVSGAIQFDSAADLAIYYLPDDYPWGREDVSFWPEKRIDESTERLATDYLFVHGFPAERSRFFSLVQGVASKSLPYGVMQRLDELPSDLRDFEFAVDFDPQNMRFQNDADAGAFVDPRGLSGSPVWRIGISGGTAAAWSPVCSLLVGFLTQWRPDERILVASLASRLLKRARQTGS